MLTRIVLAWVPAAMSLILAACGSKGDLTLPKAPVPRPAAASPVQPLPAAPPASPVSPAAPSPTTSP